MRCARKAIKLNFIYQPNVAKQMSRATGKKEVEKHIVAQLKENFRSITKDQLRNVTEKMTEITDILINIPLCESAAVGIGFSIRQSAESTAKENNLDAEILSNIIFNSVRFLRKCSN